MLILLALFGGAVLGFISADLLAANKLAKANDAATAAIRGAQDYALLKARIRAIQSNGKFANGEYIYTVQTPTGRFGKFSLPEV
jgi:hypothetical protein